MKQAYSIRKVSCNKYLVQGHSSRLAALDYTVCLYSEAFVTTQGGNFPHFLVGHRRYLYEGHAKTIKPDKRKLALLFDSPDIRLKWMQYTFKFPVVTCTSWLSLQVLVLLCTNILTWSSLPLFIALALKNWNFSTLLSLFLSLFLIIVVSKLSFHIDLHAIHVKLKTGKTIHSWQHHKVFLFHIMVNLYSTWASVPELKKDRNIFHALIMSETRDWEF